MDESRLIALERAAASGIVSRKPCLIHSICAIGLAETDNTYRIYDGQSTSGKYIMTMVAGAYSSDFRLYASPMYFAKGIYIEFTTHGEEVSVQLMELAR